MKLIRAIRRFITVIFVVILIGWGLSAYYFHHAKFHRRLDQRVNARVQTYDIHPLTYSEIPTTYIQAVIATEDRRFWWDPGIDPIGIVRSIFHDASSDGYLEGGSTITQQVADNTVIKHGHSLSYKVQQVIDAIAIWETTSKKETIATYANMIYFGDGAYGLYNASETYFGKAPNQLNDGELTMLAGIPNAPSDYNPLHSLKLAKERQQVVIQNMVNAGLITQQEANVIKNEPIRLK